MKTNALILILIISQAFSCTKHIAPTAETTYLSTQNGVLVLRSTGYCTKQSYRDQCIAEAQKNAFNTLFYRGIPGSQQTAPLLGTTNEAKGNTYLKDFYEKERYKTFITATNVVSDLATDRKWKKITVDVSINLQTLRKDLENNKVIPAFGIN